MSTQDTLPPLPDPFCNAHEDAGSYWPDMYSKEQMQAYARAAIAAQAHDEGAATRLRGICEDLGLGSAVPQTDAELMASQFAVFGMIRRALSKAASPEDKAVYRSISDNYKASVSQAQQAKAWIQQVCCYISDVLASNATSGEKHIARTLMHLLPLGDAAAPQAEPAQQPRGIPARQSLRGR